MAKNIGIKKITEFAICLIKSTSIRNSLRDVISDTYYFAIYLKMLYKTISSYIM